MKHFNDEVKQLTAAIATIDSLQNSNEAGIELMFKAIKAASQGK